MYRILARMYKAPHIVEVDTKGTRDAAIETARKLAQKILPPAVQGLSDYYQYEVVDASERPPVVVMEIGRTADGKIDEVWDKSIKKEGY